MNLQGRNLQQGLSGDDVRLLHTELSLLNPPVTIPDSERQPALFGPATVAAIQNFQKAHTLPTSGIVDPATAKAINDLVDAQFPPVLKTASVQLSLGAQGDDVARIQEALAKLGRSLPDGETSQRVLGPGTSAVVKALQQDLGLAATGAVDASTLAAINARVSQAATAIRVLRGSVLSADGAQVKGLTVTVFSQGPAGEALAGKPATTAEDGSYLVSYTPPPGGRADLRVQVSSMVSGVAYLPINVVQETVPAASSILTNAGPLEVIDFTLSGAANVSRTEYEQISSDVTPLLGARPLASLVENATQHDITLLALQSGHTADQITALVAAAQLSKDASVPAPVLYGLFRGGMSPNLAALQSTHPSVLLKALQSSTSQGVAPATVDGKRPEDLLAAMAPVSLTPLQGLFGTLLNANELGTLSALYAKSTQDPTAFWKQVAADPALSARAQKLQFTVQLATLANNHQPLIAAVSALPGIAQAPDLVTITEDKWKSLVETAGVPADTPGATADEKTNNYVQQIVGQVEAAFPTAFFAERLPDSHVKTFLKAQPAYDLISTYPAQFFKSNPAAAAGLTDSDKGQLATYQRLRRLGNTKEALAMLPLVRSAHQISRMDRQTFATLLKDTVPAGRASEIYDQALRTSAMATAIRAEHGAAHNRTSLRVLPRLDTQKQAALAASTIPDWQTLFGAFDFCACEECASAHGPAAYLVDILSFLGDRPGPAAGQSVRDALFARRPDLGDIELSCQNTNTPVPLIDIVNEILENAVAPPAPFTAFTLPAAVEADLGLAVATDALGQAFTPPLQAGARVEVLEAGVRWRIWDEAFAFSVAKSNNTLSVSARSRQTTGSAADLRATPQYRNSAAYVELAGSVFPWNLPFDLPFEEARVFLAQLGAPRRDLIAALRPPPVPFVATSPSAVSLAAERLGIHDAARKIIAGEALTPPCQPVDFWGGATVAVLTTVQELLDRSGLSYAELDLLIASWFVNPAGGLSISAKTGAPVDTCDTTNLQINGIAADALDRLHRFVRLWRALGWTIPETDKALRAFAADGHTPALTNETLVKLDHLSSISVTLRLPVLQALAFWSLIDTQELGSLYRTLFYNPAVFKPQDDAFRLRPDGQELADTNQQLNTYAANLQAAFRLNGAGIGLLIAKTDGKLNLANLSLIYRHTALARQLGLAVQDLLTAIDLTGLSPFDASHSETAPWFIEVVRNIQNSGFSIPQLDYLLRQRFNPPAPFVPLDSDLAPALTDLRTALLAQDADPGVVVDRLAAASTLPADVVGSLLNRVSLGGQTALQLFLGLTAIVLTPAAPALTRANAGPQFQTMEKLLKIASVMQTVGLPASQLDWLFRENAWLGTVPDPPAQPVPLANWYALIQLQQLRKDLALEDGAVEAILGALGTSKQGLIDALSKWLAWTPEDLAALIGNPANSADGGLLQVALPADLRLTLVVRISRAMTLVKALGVSAAAANQWCNAIVTDGSAKAIRSAAKARYDDSAWLQILTPLQNSLREKQRDALTGYLTARPAGWNSQLAAADANDLFDDVLIDVEMSSCQLTSRIQQALGSVQLFAQRCLMGLETGIPASDPKWTQWSWMKNFRVWEANREIWLYPENWIEPDLRDDKTPFFKDLENELQQSNLDNDAAEQALSHYLQKLDEVSRLEIVGSYEDDDKNLHVFGRTFNTPNTYYYRQRLSATQSWTPWEKVDLDIEGDHLIPVMWNRKLLLIWPIFSDKQMQKPVKMPPAGGTLDSADHYWEIQLAWSEYQYGRWSGKNLSDPVTLLAYLGEDNILFGPLVPHLNVMARARNGAIPPSGPDPGGNGGSGTTPPPQLPPSGSAAPRQLVPKEMISFKALVAGESLGVRGYLRRDYRAAPQNGDQQIAYPFGEFQFSGCRKIVTAVPDGQIVRRNFALGPSGTKHDAMWFTAISSGLTLFDGTFPAYPPFLMPATRLLENVPASIAGDPSTTTIAKIDIPVLDQASGYRLLAPHQDLQFVGDRPFFFSDTQRAFVVTSSGASGKRPDRNWIFGNLAATQRADYFSEPAPGPPAPPPAASFTVLVPGAATRRIARELPPVNPTPAFTAQIGRASCRERV